MNTIEFPQQKELEAAISDLHVFMDIAAVSLQETNTAGKSSHILTIILEEDDNECLAYEMNEWVDKVFKRYVEITYTIIDIRDLIDNVIEGNFYYIKWYLGGVHLFKNEEFDVIMQNEIPKAKDLLENGIKIFTQRMQKIEVLQLEAHHYAETNNHQLALFTIHKIIILLFGLVEEFVKGRAYSNSSIFRHQQIIKDFAPLFAKLFDYDNIQDNQIAELLYKAHNDFPYDGEVKIKKEWVCMAHKKMQWMYKEVKKVYTEQLAYCEEKLRTSEEPETIPTVVNNEIVNDEIKISNIITSYSQTRAIYCFGKRETAYSSNNTIYPNKELQGKHTHLYLLVLVEETIENATNDISDKIKTKTDGSITATLLIHQLSNLKKICDDQQYFFWQIMQNAELIYQNAEKSPYLNTTGTPKRNLKTTSLYAANRKNNISTIWGWVYNDDDAHSSDEVKMSGLHQIVEQTCLSLIRVFLGYTPNHFSLDYLFNLCEYFTTITTELFPRKTQEDQSMFKLLKQQPSALRFSKANDVDYLYYELLEERCSKFKNQADVLIQKELDRFKETESKQDKNEKNN
jgi:hypothetical protein